MSMAESFDFDPVEHFTAGAVGQPGDRVFYLQAGAAGQLASIKCEKQQVSALAEYLAGVIADLPPAEPPERPLDLLEPVIAAWTAGMVSVAFDQAADRIVIVIEEVRPEDFQEPEDPDEPSAAERAPLSDPTRASLRVRLTRSQVVGFIAHATELVESGRPACPLCGNPMGENHACPRTNGHGPPR
jgi:uncharacterized repeat protein (TIGR03847 family)